jgi:hypothetical protein
MNDIVSFNNIVQIGLIGFTGLGFLLTSLKRPQYGLIANLVGQIFWLYSSYRAWREADQLGIFVSTIFVTIIQTTGLSLHRPLELLAAALLGLRSVLRFPQGHISSLSPSLASGLFLRKKERANNVSVPRPSGDRAEQR